MRFTALLPVIILLASLPLAAAEGLAGRYTLLPERSDAIPQAIERVVADMNFIKRPFARSRLTKTNAAYRTLRLDLGAALFRIQFEGRQPIETPADGRAVGWTREDGERFQVSTRMEGGNLVQRFVAEDGSRRNTYHLDPDGTLRLQAEISSSKLPRPLTYTLVYRRD